MSTAAAVRTVILAAIDRSASAETVLAHAAKLALSLEGAELHLTYVIDDPRTEPEAVRTETLTQSIEEGRLYLDELTKRAAALGVKRVASHLTAGVPWREIVQLATSLDADFVIAGTHDYGGLKRLVLGSTSDNVARKAPCPVLVVRPKRHDPDVPEIEPPCSDCIAVQKETAGARLWCDRHSARHLKPHLHYESPASFGLGSAIIRPWM